MHCHSNGFGHEDLDFVLTLKWTVVGDLMEHCYGSLY